jgi:aromatic ring hydroxylase
MAYTKIKYIIEQTVASGLIYLNSSSRDFKNPEIRPYLDKYMRGSGGGGKARQRCCRAHLMSGAHAQRGAAFLP